MKLLTRCSSMGRFNYLCNRYDNRILKRYEGPGGRPEEVSLTLRTDVKK